MRGALALALVGLVLGGCGYRLVRIVPSRNEAGPPPAASPALVSRAPARGPISVPRAQRTVTYREGRYHLHGAGTAASPFHWVWVPTDVTLPAAPPLPTR